MITRKLTSFVFTLLVPFLLSAESERTLSIIKPDGVKNHHIGDVISRFEHAGLQVAGMKMVQLTPEQAGEFYKVHSERPFYSDLVSFISSGPIVVMVLEGDDAIAKNRKMMGATDPKKADKGTLRADFAQSIDKNAVHGSDSPEAAKVEIELFFPKKELFNY
jgi:nucleoside-diphosphate kinase